MTKGTVTVHKGEFVNEPMNSFNRYRSISCRNILVSVECSQRIERPAVHAVALSYGKIQAFCSNRRSHLTTSIVPTAIVNALGWFSGAGGVRDLE
jgi:hypothetical protein